MEKHEYTILEKTNKKMEQIQTYNHVERRCSKGKRNGNGGDLVHWFLQVNVSLDALEQPG